MRPEHEGLDIKAKGTIKGINKKKKIKLLIIFEECIMESFNIATNDLV